MPDKSFADLLREAGVQPSGAIQYAQSLNRPVPYRNYTPPRPLPRRMRPADVRAYDDNPGVAQQAMGEMRRDRMTGQDAMLREAQGPASNQFADAGMVALETTGVPALRRSYDAFEAGDPRQGIYEGIWGGLGLAGTLGAIPGARRGAARLPTREPVLPQMREPPAPPSGSVLPVRPPQPFRQSLIGGADDLTGASHGVFSEGPPDGMPTRPPDADNGGVGQEVTLDVNSPNERSYNSPNTSVIIERQPGDDAFSVSWGLRGRQPRTMVERAGIEREGIEAAIQAIRTDAQANPGAAYQFQGTHGPLIRRYRRMAEQAANAAGFTVTERNGSLVLRPQSPDGGAAAAGNVDLGHVRYWVERYGGGPDGEAAALREITKDLRNAERGEGATWQRRQRDLRAQIAAIESGEYRRGPPNPSFSARVEAAFPELYATPNAPTAGPSRPPPDTSKSYRPGPPKGGFFFSRRR